MRFKPLEYTIEIVKGNSKKRALVTLKSASNALKSLKKSIHKLEPAVALLKARKGNIVVTGVGKSGFIGQKIAATLTSLGHRAAFLHPVEALHGDLGTVGEGDVVIAISFSGESQEVVRLIKYLKKDFNVEVLAITKNVSTPLGKLATIVLPLFIKDEGCPLGVAPMASTTATLVLGDMLAAALTEPKDFKKTHFARLHPGGGLALSLRTVGEVMTKGIGVPLVDESANFTMALVKMSEKHLGVTGVVHKSGNLAGIVTDGDVRRFLISKKFSIGAQVGLVMTKNPKTTESGMTLKDALALMEKYRITSLFVLRAKKPIGIIHIHDIIEGNII